jgi:hypothetical protein
MHEGYRVESSANITRCETEVLAEIRAVPDTEEKLNDDMEGQRAQHLKVVFRLDEKSLG